MKREFNKLYITLGLLFLIVLAINSISAGTGNSCSLTVSLINQDPYPAVPGEYVNVVFQLSGVQNSQCNGAKFELIPSYPFFLENNSLKTLQGNTNILNYKNDWMIPYKLRVDKNALDGDNEVQVHYGSGGLTSDSYIVKNFNITVRDSRTTFDAVIQETTSSEVSIAIANTGKYAANSVVVRIPEQESFRVTGTDGQMVGNLESGDYTIVGFSVSPKGGSFRNMTRSNPPTNNGELENKLKFDIHYTDNLGQRRIVNMELPLNMGNSSIMGARNFAGSQTNSQNNSSFFNGYTLIIAIIVLVGVFIVYKRYFKPVKKVSKIEETIIRDITKIPDWIKNAKNKGKNK